MKSYGWLFLVAILVTSSLPFSQAARRTGHELKTGVFLSPKIELGPGMVSYKFYSNVDFPRGHVALKDFNAELIDEAGNSVPLHDTYLHHWLVLRFFVRKGLENQDVFSLNSSDYISGRNAGTCNDRHLDQFFGLGPETRRTTTRIPDPYGIEIGNPNEIPPGYVETWAINVHAIDTRGVEDTMGCTECRCDLYEGTTRDQSGRPLSLGGDGGVVCCYDGAQCRMKEGFHGLNRTLYLRYTVKWIDMDRSVVPVKVYIFDVTDMWRPIDTEHYCWVEYQVDPCRATGPAPDRCIDNRRISLDMPFSGNVIYGVGHQHGGGTGATLYRKDGRRLCSSIPIYGEGKEAGDEAGYVVGMSSCYPKPGTVKISKGETLILESNYSNVKPHYGVMGLFYILVAEESI